VLLFEPAESPSVMWPLVFACLSPLIHVARAVRDQISDDVIQAVIETAGRCPYTTLLNADTTCVPKTSCKSVKLNVCGSWKTVSTGTQTYTTFGDVDWWNPLPDHAFTEDDAKFIDGYTGHFWFSRNVGMLFKGKAPSLKSEDREGRWTSTGRAELVQEVLKFGVSLGTALNKLPVSADPVNLSRGEWVPKDVIEILLTKPQGFSQPWFQSTTSNEEHSLMFLRPEHAPSYCRDLKPGGCIGQDLAFPAQVTFQTKWAKDVTKWNEKEHEHIVLPNSPFNVVVAEKVMNDPLFEMTNEELATWFETEKELPEWCVRLFNVQKVGPWPSYYPDAIRAHPEKGGHYFATMMSDWGHYRLLPEFGLDPHDDYAKAAYRALKCRFTTLLPGERLTANESPYWYRIVLSDASDPTIGM